MVLEKNIVDEAGQYIFDLFKEKLSHYYVYHNYQHTLDTVEACSVLSKELNISNDDLICLELAAWFHDSGYVYQYQGHEDKSIELANQF